MRRGPRVMWAGSTSRLTQSRPFVAIITVCVVLVLDSWLRGALHLQALENAGRGAGHGDLRAQRGLHDVSTRGGPGWSTPRWELAPTLRAQIVAAIPLGAASVDWVRTSRHWRRGIRAAFVTDFQAGVDLRLEGGTQGEEFLFLNASDTPYGYYGRAALTPSLAHEHFGEYNYKWMLYGDDDTIWHLDTVESIVKGLDPDMPHFITDHIWFWGPRTASPKAPSHPAWDAPRCVPCGFNRSLLAGKELPFQPPSACPYCTWQALCAADGARRDLYGPNCEFKPRYPQDGEYLAHGGGGIILSVGLMRMLSSAYIRECIASRFKRDQVFGGDTMFSHCAFFKGVAPTDPGHFFFDPQFNAFDQGGQLVRNGMDLTYSYLKRAGCCDAACEARLASAVSVHLRGLHFKEPAAAMDTARLIVHLRDMYLDIRQRAQHDPAVAKGYLGLTPSWDVHRVCN